MSYECFYETLCDNGHYANHNDNYGVGPHFTEVPCVFCKCFPLYYHEVDITNGVIQGDPNTVRAPKEKIGHDDGWKEDHYGNKFAVMHDKFAPNDLWEKIDRSAPEDKHYEVWENWDEEAKCGVEDASFDNNLSLIGAKRIVSAISIPGVRYAYIKDSLTGERVE